VRPRASPRPASRRSPRGTRTPPSGSGPRAPPPPSSRSRGRRGGRRSEASARRSSGLLRLRRSAAQHLARVLAAEAHVLRAHQRGVGAPRALLRGDLPGGVGTLAPEVVEVFPLLRIPAQTGLDGVRA